MMCCNICPFHPISGNTQERCLAPVCSQKQGACSPGPCARLIPHRCLQDEYVITQLYRSDRLARRLAPETFETALVSRNQPLLLCLFHAAPTELALHFWQRMKEEFSHLMHLLNPIFSSSGLLPLYDMRILPSNEAKYRQAIISAPYVGRHLRNTTVT